MTISYRTYFSLCRLFFSCACMLSPLLSQAQFARLYSANKTLEILHSVVPDTTRLRLMDDLCEFYINKPGEVKTDLDSALNLLHQSEPIINKLNDPSWMGKYYLLKSKALRELGDKINGEATIQKAIAILTQHQLTLLLADANWELVQYHGFDTHEETVIKLDMLQKTAALYEQAGNAEKQARTLQVLADISMLDDNYDTALKALEKSLALYKSIRDESEYGVYDLLGVCYSALGNNTKAIEYGLLAVQTAHRIKDTGMIVTLYNRLALSFSRAGMHNEAISYLDKSIGAAVNVGDTSDIILLSISLANMSIAFKRPTAALEKLKNIEKNFIISNLNSRSQLYCSFIYAYTDVAQYQNALLYTNKLYSLRAAESYDIDVSRSLVRYYFAIGNYEKVYAHCDSMEAFSKKTHFSEAFPLIHFWRFKTDSATGKLISAIKEYQLYTDIKDSVSNEKSRKEIARLNIAFETDKKDNAIKSNQQYILDLQKEDKLKTAEISRARFTRNVIIGGTCMLLLLLGLLYNQYRIKQKSNENLLNKQQEINKQNISLKHLVEEKEWLVKEIHHRVKNNLQVIMSLLNTQSDYSDNAASFSTIRKSRQRVYAMSLIHQKLYQTEQMTLVNMSVYIPELVDFLKDSFADGSRVRFELQIANIDLDVSQAVPVGLILNELITNSIKYAFNGMPGAIIKINMNVQADGNIQMILHDNGIGLAQGFDLTKKGTMGIQLIKTLAEQLEGTVSFTNENGLVVMLNFTQKMIAPKIHNVNEIT